MAVAAPKYVPPSLAAHRPRSQPPHFALKNLCLTKLLDWFPRIQFCEEAQPVRTRHVWNPTVWFGWMILSAIFALSAVSLFAADVDGSWNGQFAPSMNPANVHKFILELKADGGKLTGTMAFCHPDCSNPTGTLAIEDGKIDGDTISFGIDTEAQDVPHIDFQGTVNGASISFIVSGKAPNCANGSGCQIGTGSATRTNLQN